MRVDPASGYNEEELKVIQRPAKIFGDPDIRVSATCVVPVPAHAMAIYLRV
jgi:aspartate-semialdehyde dehydrogenase